MSLAADPFSSTPAQQWDRFCELLWFNGDLGFWLDISRMALGPAELEHLRPRFAAAFEAMAALEAGALANADEQRMVGHYWLRAPELAPDQATADHIRSEIDRIEAFGHQLLDGKVLAPTGVPFTDVLWIGIGGSGLGPLLMIRALHQQGRGLPFHFFDNVDPDGMSRTLAAIGERLRTTLVSWSANRVARPSPASAWSRPGRALRRSGATGQPRRLP